MFVTPVHCPMSTVEYLGGLCCSKKKKPKQNKNLQFFLGGGLNKNTVNIDFWRVLKCLAGTVNYDSSFE